MKKVLSLPQAPLAGTLPKDSNPDSLFLDELKDLYGAEQHQVILLPAMKKAATSPQLQRVLAGHLDCTRDQISRLEQIFEQMGQKAEARSPEVMWGINREAETVIAGTGRGIATRDAGLILTAQKLEHYEIAAYSSLAQLARTLEYDDTAEMLEEILNEEKEADDLLTCVAGNYINTAASRE